MRNEKQEMRWYTIRTQNNKERSVMEKLIQEVKFYSLDSKFGRTIIPTEKVATVKNGKKVFRDKIVYPGYIFIETCAVGEITSILKAINGSGGFVRTRTGNVIPMQDYEVKKIIVEQEVSDNTDINSIYVVNEEVKVIDGPFETFKGIVTHVDVERSKVKIEVAIFGRATVVDLAFSQIEKM